MPISKTYPLPALTDVDDNLDPNDGEVLTWDGDAWKAKPAPVSPLPGLDEGDLVVGGPGGIPTALPPGNVGDRLRIKQGDTAQSWDRGHVYNVRDYGAIGDGVADDKAAVQLAMDTCGAAGGGTVYFPIGTYRLATVTTVSSFLYALTWSYDNVTLAGDGPGSRVFLDVGTNAAIFLIAGQAKAARIAGDISTWPNYNIFQGSTAAPAYTLSGTIAEGATSVTTATPADAGNFVVGEYIAIRTGQCTGTTATGQPDAELNIVKSVNAGTGAVVLDTPTVKAYQQEYYVTGTTGVTSTSVTANLAPFQIVRAQNRILTGGRLRDCFLETRATRHAIIGGQTDDFVVERVNGLFRGGYSFMSFGTTRGQRVRHCLLTHRGLLGWTNIVSVDTGSSDCQWLGLDVSSDTHIPYLHIHEGAALTTVRDCYLRSPQVAGDFANISMRARGYRTLIDGVKIDGGGNTAAIYMDPSVLGGGSILNCRVRNAIVVSAVGINGPGWIVRNIDSDKQVSYPPTVDNLGPVGPETLAGWLADNRVMATLGTLPTNCIVTGVRIAVAEVFNSPGTDLIKVGFPSGGENWLATDTDVSTLGLKATVAGVSFGQVLTTARTIVANYTAGGTAPTTGKALILVDFFRGFPVIP